MDSQSPFIKGVLDLSLLNGSRPSVAEETSTVSLNDPTLYQCLWLSFPGFICASLHFCFLFSVFTSSKQLSGFVHCSHTSLQCPKEAVRVCSFSV